MGALDVQAKLEAEGTPQAEKQRESDAKAGALAAIKGKTPTDAQVKAGFTLAATAAYASLAGVSLATAAGIMGPLAAVVFGAGYGLGALVQKVLGIHNGTTQIRTCSAEDTQHGTDPTDPKWVHYDAQDGVGPWQPATHGAFERWARPIIMRAVELTLNCKPLVGAATWRDYVDKGLVGSWNALFPGAPLRRIPSTGNRDAQLLGEGRMTAAVRDARARDPVQMAIQLAWERQTQGGAPGAKEVAPALPNPDGNSAGLDVADPTPAQAARALGVGVMPIGVHLGHFGGAVKPIAVHLGHFGRSQPTTGQKVARAGIAGSIIAGLVAWLARRRSS